MLSPELCHSMGLRPGARLRAEVDGNTLWLHRPLNHLAKVYIEPTDVCNLDCVTYFRNTWQSPHWSPIRRDLRCRVGAFEAGRSASDRSTLAVSVSRRFTSVQLNWIARVKQLGARVEMITNGTLLTEKRSRQLINAGLDLL